MSTATILTCLAIGILSGVVASLCGVGGGVVMVPAFVFFLKLEQKTAVATSLAIIIPTALMATTQNARSGYVEWKVAAITAISASIFAYFGDALTQASPSALVAPTGLFLGVLTLPLWTASGRAWLRGIFAPPPVDVAPPTE